MKQLGTDKQKAADVATKKATQTVTKVKKAQNAIKVFKSIDRTPGKDEWKDIIMFVLPRLDKETAPSKVSSMKKAKEKLAELATKHNTSWLALVEEELDKANTEAAAFVGEADTNAMTAELWDKILAAEEPEDTQLTVV